MKKSITTILLIFFFLSTIVQAQQPEVTITTGHSQPVMKVALAPQGNLIASNGTDHQIKIWDKSTGKEITTLSNKVKGIDGNLSGKEKVHVKLHRIYK